MHTYPSVQCVYLAVLCSSGWKHHLKRATWGSLYSQREGEEEREVKREWAFANFGFSDPGDGGWVLSLPLLVFFSFV